MMIYSLALERIALPLASALSRSRFWESYREMLQSEALPLEDLEGEQWPRFRELLDHAYDRVPYYRDRLDGAGVRPEQIGGFGDLWRVPVTTKRDIQRNFPDRMVAAGADHDDWQYVSTRGTADRLIVIQDFFKRDMVRAAAVRSLFLSGGYRVGMPTVEIPPDICSIVCGAEGESLDGVFSHLWHMTREGLWRDPEAVSTLRGRVERNWVYRKRTYRPFGPRGTTLPAEDLETYVRAIRRDRPYLLKALPTYLVEIARHVEQTGGEPLPVRVVKPMGSSVAPRMRQLIERNADGDYREEYGSAEFGDMACDCELGDGLHVFTDLFLIEVVRGTKPVADGRLGKVLITDLSNRAMPMIRYQIGDVGRLRRGPHGCGRAAPRLWLEGRLEDTIVTDGGGVFSSDLLVEHFQGFEGVSNFQLLEKRSGRLELLVVPADGAPVREERLAAGLKELLQTDREVSVYPVKTIKPEASGKFRFVQSSSYRRLDESTVDA